VAGLVLACVGTAAAAAAGQGAPGRAGDRPAERAAAADEASVQPGSSAPSFELKTAPPAAAEQRFESALRPRPGGLRADEVARRAELSSPEVLAKQRAVEAAAAKVDQAAVNFAPRLSLLARYVRLSSITIPTLGYIVGAQSEGPVYVYCPPPAAVAGNPTQPVTCQAAAGAAAFSFPVVLNMYTLQGTLAIPLSDYLLRIPQSYASATKSVTAARVQERAVRAKVARDARVSFYNWARAGGGVLVAEQGLATAQAHLKDVNAAVLVGSASKADFMRVESQVAQTEMLVERTRNLRDLVEEQLRTMMHDAPGTRYELGEDLMAAPSPVLDGRPVPLGDLFQEADQRRLELRAIDETVASLRETRRVIDAGYLPRLDAFGNVYHQNPNTRYFPQKEEWKMTWDVGVQLSWTVNDTFATSGQAAELDAKVQEILAQRGMLRDGIRLEVTQAYNAARESEVALRTTARQLAAAEESYRVRRELFRAGKATSAELTDAETDLMRSRLEALNARVDARIARANLEHALGRDAAPSGP
jgi:outer membrane protein TolC